jgi:glycosyltransferase involved in cell wall biosynthesis
MGNHSLGKNSKCGQSNKMSRNIVEEKITIVVPCKNEENYIHHLLESLRQQDIGKTRIIIADCSTDNTRQVIKNCSSSLNVEIIEGGSVSFAKNSGAKLVTTPYILFLDADVRFFKNNAILYLFIFFKVSENLNKSIPF